MVFEHPRDQLARRQLAEHRARKKLRRALGESARGNRLTHPFVVGAVGEHEFDLVAPPDVLEVTPAISVALAAPGALEIDDLVHAAVDERYVGLAARFEEDGPPPV